jgi:hypothetical protein
MNLMNRATQIVRCRSLFQVVIASALALCLSGCAANVRAQADLQKTPWTTTMVYPVGNPLDYKLPAAGDHNGFNLSRGVNLGRRGDRHEGLDLANRTQGGEIRAVAPGLVICTRKDKSGWGNMVVLAHRLPGGDILFSLFAHMLPGSVRVKEGQIVALGQPLGKVGSTGHSTGPHLHLEFRSLTGSIDKLRTPLAQAWERASIVDPLRIFASLRPRGDAFGVPAALAAGGSTALTASPALDMPADPFLLQVQGGGLPKTALDRPDLAVTRGELYRLAYATLADGAAVPARWTTLRPRLVKAARALPASARTAFADARLPRRSIDAQAPASLAETREVMLALQAARSANPRLARARAGTPSRADLEAGFPQGLTAFETASSTFAAAPLARGTVGPPAVSRRQACMLLAYVAGGGSTGAAITSSESQ